MSVVELNEPISLDLAPPRQRMTIAEFLTLPDDGVDRMLIAGELWEMGMTLRSHLHAEVAANIASCLVIWCKAQPKPRGRISVGDAGFRLAADDTMVGPDVAYASAEVLAQTPAEVAFYAGPPVLAVEVLSPSDRMDDIAAKVDKYLQVGTVVWEVNPRYRSVLVHRPGAEVELFNINQELIGDPYLPGFRVAVAEIFAD